MVARYGEFVRYRPAVDSATAWLWYGPLVLLSAAVLSVFWVVRGRASGSADPQANAEALATLRERLAERDKADTRD
jgi:cytochrome c-type biogenesis protein CcmH